MSRKAGTRGLVYYRGRAVFKLLRRSTLGTLPWGIGIYTSRKPSLSSIVVIEKVKLTIVNLKFFDTHLESDPMIQRGEDLKDRLLDCAASVGKLVDALPDTRLVRHIAGQLVRSGTSPAPNYAEAYAIYSCQLSI